MSWNQAMESREGISIDHDSIELIGDLKIELLKIAPDFPLKWSLTEPEDLINATRNLRRRLQGVDERK